MTAATETINGVKYNVVYLDGNTANNKEKIAACTANTAGNYKYVMTANWTMGIGDGGIILLNGNSVIWDLNGHTLSVAGIITGQGNNWFRVYCTTFEITDTSAKWQQTGRVITTSTNRSCAFSMESDHANKFIISGGTFDCNIHFHGGHELLMTGGTLLGTTWVNTANTTIAVTLAEWMTGTISSNGTLTAAAPKYDYYDQASGLGYEVISLTGDYDASNAQLKPSGSTGNYLYIMTADLDTTCDTTSVEHIFRFYGNSVIWDLNGHTIKLGGWNTTNRRFSGCWYTYAASFEVTDSSAMHSGVVEAAGIIHLQTQGSTNVTISGGNLNGNLEIKYNTPDTNKTYALNFTGGNYGNIGYRVETSYGHIDNFNVATYMNATYDANGRVTACYDTRYYEKINGLMYKVVKLSDDYSAVVTQLAPYGNTENYKYVMTADLDLTATAEHTNRQLNFWGDASYVIFDLNGHTLTVNGWSPDFSGCSWFNIRCQTFEFTDSSATQSGQVKSDNIILGDVSEVDQQTIIISGGTLVEGVFEIRLATGKPATTNVVFFGGDLGKVRYRAGYNYPANECVAPWMTATYDSTGHVTSAKGYNHVNYQVIFLTGDGAANVAKIDAANADTQGNYYYILQEDWDLVAGETRVWLRGKNVVFDLHGHRTHCNNGGEGGYFFRLFAADTVEVTDTSVQGGGYLHISVIDNTAKNLICSGRYEYAEIQAGHDEENPLNVIVRGGQHTNFYSWTGYTMCNFTAPYARQERIGNREHFYHYDYYAVSDSELYSGAYNYVYGLAWDIDIFALNTLAIPTDKPYYVWARNQNDTWYQCLGQWRYELPQLGNWLGYAFPDRWSIVDAGTVALNGKAGIELWGTPVAVTPHTDYVITCQASINDFNPHGTYQGLFFGVTAEPTHEGCVNALAGVQIIANYQDKITLSFNSGDLTQIYLMVNGGYAADNQEVVLTLSDLQMIVA